MNSKILEKTIANFVSKQKNNRQSADENWQERIDRTKFYQSYTSSKLLAMTEEEFAE